MRELAATLDSAREECRAITALSSQYTDLTLEQGYQVQQLGLDTALARGEKLAGYKMGLTSRAKQRDVNVHEPIRGYLLEGMEIAKGERVATKGRIHPRIEPEVAVVLKARLAGAHVTLRDVEQALSIVTPAMEILDSRFQSFSFKLPDVVADNTSASGFVLGSQNWIDRLDQLRLMGVTVKHNGVIVETGAPAAVLGDPLLSVVALARSLAAENKAIEPGMVILTGGITTSVSFKAGDVIEVVWPTETMSFVAE